MVSKIKPVHSGGSRGLQAIIINIIVVRYSNSGTNKMNANHLNLKFFLSIHKTSVLHIANCGCIRERHVRLLVGLLEEKKVKVNFGSRKLLEEEEEHFPSLFGSR